MEWGSSQICGIISKIAYQMIHTRRLRKRVLINGHKSKQVITISSIPNAPKLWWVSFIIFQKSPDKPSLLRIIKSSVSMLTKKNTMTSKNLSKFQMEKSSGTKSLSTMMLVLWAWQEIVKVIKKISRQTHSTNIMVLNDFVPLDFSIWNLLRFFEVIVFFLVSIETLDLMILKSEGLSGDFWKIMNETHHSLGALGIELIVITCFDLWPLINTLFLSLLVWIIWYAIFDIIPQICDEPHSIVKLNI
jgi:hypothetical protein